MPYRAVRAIAVVCVIATLVELRAEREPRRKLLPEPLQHITELDRTHLRPCRTPTSRQGLGRTQALGSGDSAAPKSAPAAPTPTPADRTQAPGR